MNYDQTAKEAIVAWDAGESLWTIEMGGLGPGYEQCIQTAALEILRDAIAAEEASEEPLNLESFMALRDSTISKHDEALGGMSGAQAGAATQIAWKAYTLGWGAMLKEAKDQGVEDRFILVSSHWPKTAAA